MAEKDPTRIYSRKLEELSVKDGFNVRIDTLDSKVTIEELAKSIATVGLKDPLVVFEEGEETFIEDGHRRFAAILVANKELAANIETVKVRYNNKATDEERTVNLMVRQGEPLALLEQAEVVRRLLFVHKLEEQAVADKVGASISHIKNLRLLIDAPEGVKALIVEDKVSASHAIEAMRKFGDKAEEALVQALVMVEGKGKKRVTNKTLKATGPKTNWKEIGPRLRDMIEILLSIDTSNVEAIKGNLEDAKMLLVELGINS